MHCQTSAGFILCFVLYEFYFSAELTFLALSSFCPWRGFNKFILCIFCLCSPDKLRYCLREASQLCEKIHSGCLFLGEPAPGLASLEMGLRLREVFYASFIPGVKILWEFLRFCSVPPVCLLLVGGSPRVVIISAVTDSCLLEFPLKIEKVCAGCLCSFPLLSVISVGLARPKKWGIQDHSVNIVNFLCLASLVFLILLSRNSFWKEFVYSSSILCPNLKFFSSNFMSYYSEWNH